MYFLSMSDNGHLAFTGRHFVHIYSTRFVHTKSVRTHLESSQALTSLDLRKYTPSSYKTGLEKISGVCCAIAKDSTKVVAVDSEKHIYIFEKASHHPDYFGNSDKMLIGPSIRAPSWDHFTTFKMDVKVLRALFDTSASYLFILDRHGKVYISNTSTPTQIASPVRMVGHFAVTQDLIQDEVGKYLFTCDGNETLQYSCYSPEEMAKEDAPPNHVSEFLLSTSIDSQQSSSSSPIVSIALLNHDHYVLATHADGIAKLWDFDNHKVLQSWNLFNLNHGVAYKQLPEHEIRRLKLTESYGHIFFAVKIAMYKEVPIFQMDIHAKTARKLGQIKLEFDYSDFIWSDSDLYVYNPDSNSLMKRFIVSSNGVSGDPYFQVPSIGRHRHDFQSFVQFYNESASLTKYFSNDLIHVRHGQMLMKEFAKNEKKKAAAAAAHTKDQDQPTQGTSRQYRSERFKSYTRNSSCAVVDEVESASSISKSSNKSEDFVPAKEVLNRTKLSKSLEQLSSDLQKEVEVLLTNENGVDDDDDSEDSIPETLAELVLASSSRLLREVVEAEDGDPRPRVDKPAEKTEG